MALVVNDRVKETSTTTGTGTFDLGGAVSGFESFVTAIGNGNTTYYSIVNENGEFEVGLGTVTDAATDTLSRDTIISSSNSDAAVNFSAGTKNVFCTLPASKAVILDSSGNIVANNGSNLTNLNADNLASGTVPDARFPATLPAANGSALTDLNATNVASGTLASDRLPTVPTTKGGTGLTSIGTANQVLAVNGAGTALEYTDTLTNKTLDDATVTTGLNFGNIVKANFGDSDELQIFSNSSQAKSFVKTDTNTLALSTNNRVTINNGGGNVFFEADLDGSTDLYYNLVKKFETTNTGVTVTGTASATTFSGSGASLTALNADNIASGTLASDRLPTVPTTKGGTGLTAIGTANQVLAVNSGGTALEYQTPTTGDITGVTAGSGLTGGGTTGDVTLNVGAGTGVTVNADDIAIGQDVATSATPTFAGLTTTADINFGDNDKAQFGASNDLQIYHTGTNSIIDDLGTGNLLIRSDGAAISLQVNSKNSIRAVSDAEVELYHNNNLKLETTSSGIDVTGTMTATTFSGSGASLTSIPNGALDNSAITINGTSTSLGGSINVGDITGVTAGTGLSGGGTSGDVTLDLDLNELTTSTADADGDFFAVVDSIGAQKKLTKGNIAISGFNNDSGFTTNTGTVTSVSGGNGLTGTVTTSGSLAVGAGTLIDVTADAVNVDLSELTTSTSDADGDFFVVVDSVNAQKKLTKANINISGFNNDAGYSTTTGTVTSVGVTAGVGLSGGGTITTSGTVTLTVDLSELTDMTVPMVGTDEFIVLDAGADRRKAANEIGLSIFNNDSGFTTNTGTVTSVGVTAGSGLTGGGTVTSSGTVTLNVGAGTGIDVAADSIAVDVSDFMTNGANNRIVTATGTDAMNAEANMTFDGSTLTVTGAITTTGNVTSDHVLPNTSDTYDLGAVANVWRNIYTGDLHLSNEGKEEGNSVDGTKGNWTIQEGAEDLYILNNKSGKKYRFKLEEM